MSKYNRDDLNKMEIAVRECIETTEAIEEDVKKICRDNGLSLLIAGETIGGGGRHTGDQAIPGSEHLYNRFYQHIAGMRVVQWNISIITGKMSWQ